MFCSYSEMIYLHDLRDQKLRVGIHCLGCKIHFCRRKKKTKLSLDGVSYRSLIEDLRYLSGN